MEMEARRAFAAGQQEVWDTLHDPHVLKACLAGCETFDEVEPGHHQVDWLLKLGSATVRFAGNVFLMESVPPERYRVDFDGDGGVAGSGKGSARARLIALPDYAPEHPRCQLHYSLSTELAGNITKVDPRLVDGGVAALVEQFFRRFEEQLRRRYPRAAPAELSTDPAAMDDAERAGAPTMLLDRSARVSVQTPVTAEAKAASTPSWVWATVAAAVVVVSIVLFLQLR